MQRSLVFVLLSVLVIVVRGWAQSVPQRMSEQATATHEAALTQTLQADGFILIYPYTWIDNSQQTCAYQNYVSSTVDQI